MIRHSLSLGCFVTCCLLLNAVWPTPLPAQWPGKEKLLEKVEKTFGSPPGMVRLDPENRVWVDKKKRRLVVDGYIALDNGPLEMFACLAGTKEHESIVAVFSKAFVIHAGLLAVGAEKGEPVKWEPEYQPPTGSEIKVYVLWKDEDGKRQNIDARQWIRQIGTDDKLLEENFVFAGSTMYKDPETGEEHYQAESGDLICVSNFSTATLDVPIKSLSSNTLLMFATYSERIPERGTPVRLVLQVVDANKDTAKPAQPAAPAQVAPASAEAPATAGQTEYDFSGLSDPPGVTSKQP